MKTQGTTRDSSFSYTSEAGTWTVSAKGDYVWHWVANAAPRLAVVLAPRAEQPRVAQEPMPAPSPIPTPSLGISWQLNMGGVAGLVIIGLVTFLLVRRQGK